MLTHAETWALVSSWQGVTEEVILFDSYQDALDICIERCREVMGLGPDEAYDEDAWHVFSATYQGNLEVIRCQSAGKDARFTLVPDQAESQIEQVRRFVEDTPADLEGQRTRFVLLALLRSIEHVVNRVKAGDEVRIGDHSP